MSLPVAKLSPAELRNAQTTYFKSGYVVTTPFRIKARKHTRERTIEVPMVILDLSTALCDVGYEAVCHTLNRDETLRYLVTGSRQRVFLDQVVEFKGYGIIEMPDPAPRPGKLVEFLYHPLIDGRIKRMYASLHTCDLGKVISREEFESMHLKQPA